MSFRVLEQFTEHCVCSCLYSSRHRLFTYYYVACYFSSMIQLDQMQDPITNVHRVQIQQMMSKQHEYNENAVSCFFTALRLNSAFGIFLVPHLLALLAHPSFLTPCPMQTVVRDEMQHGPPPAHVLLPHVHYLVESLSRGEREIAKWLLRHVAQAFPQAAYPPLRVGVCHAREVVQKWLKEHEAASAAEQVRLVFIKIVIELIPRCLAG